MANIRSRAFIARCGRSGEIAPCDQIDRIESDRRVGHRQKMKRPIRDRKKPRTTPPRSVRRAAGACDSRRSDAGSRHRVRPGRDADRATKTKRFETSSSSRRRAPTELKSPARRARGRTRRRPGARPTQGHQCRNSRASCGNLTMRWRNSRAARAARPCRPPGRIWGVARARCFRVPSGVRRVRRATGPSSGPADSRRPRPGRHDR